MRTRVLILLLLLVGRPTASPAADSGRLESLDSLRLPGLLPRPVEVWLPPGYDASSERYPVLYAQDGQNLFDPARSFSGVDWGLDEALAAGIQSGRLRPVIVVAVGNTAQRRREYTPRSLYDLATPAEQAEFCAQEGGPSVSDLYLEGLVGELIPRVNRRYRTLGGPEQTFLLGSSRGALFSLEALGRHPEAFGGAACLSTHWTLAGSHLENWLAALLPPVGGQRIYFDRGDQTLDAGYGPGQARADSLLAARGWSVPERRLSLFFPGHEHHERAWRQRVGPALEWLLGPPAAAAPEN
ncbi:MAG: alpha/beta hydrolase-fold protein [Candidatus Delongbacteria bacterium]